MTSSGGLPMLQWAFACVWNWDARPFPTFPLDSAVWGDTANWATGDWTSGLRTSLVSPTPTPPPTPGTYSTFPGLSTLGWSVNITPRFSTGIVGHVSGRESRAAVRAWPLFDIELTYELLRTAAAYEEFQAIAGFFEEQRGADEPFWIAPPGPQRVRAADRDRRWRKHRLLARGFSGAVYGAGLRNLGRLGSLSQRRVARIRPGPSRAAMRRPSPSPPRPKREFPISADFGVLWLCRFADDVLEFKQFMAQLFALNTLKLQSVRP